MYALNTPCQFFGVCVFVESSPLCLLFVRVVVYHIVDRTPRRIMPGLPGEAGEAGEAGLIGARVPPEIPTMLLRSRPEVKSVRAPLPARVQGSWVTEIST